MSDKICSRKRAELWDSWVASNAPSLELSSCDKEKYLYNRLWNAFMAGGDAFMSLLGTAMRLTYGDTRLTLLFEDLEDHPVNVEIVTPHDGVVDGVISKLQAQDLALASTAGGRDFVRAVLKAAGVE